MRSAGDSVNGLLGSPMGQRTVATAFVTSVRGYVDQPEFAYKCHVTDIYGTGNATGNSGRSERHRVLGIH